MSALRDAMRALSATLSASLGRTGVVAHRLTKGELREEELREAFRPHFPRRFELTSGVIVNLTGAESLQQDLILADSATVPPLIASGSLTVQPIEAVVASIEVKSRATSETVRDGVLKALSVAALVPSTPRGFTQHDGASIGFGETTAKPFGGIIAFESSASRDTVVSAFADAHPRDRPTDKCNALVIPGQFCLCWAGADGGLAPLAGAESPRIAVIDAGEDSLLVFYVTLMQAIRDFRPLTLSMVDYFQAAGVELSAQHFDLS